MKKNIIFYFILAVILSSCVTNISTVKNDSDFKLEKNEGYILLRIINSDAGRVISEFYDGNGNILKNRAPLHTNSDLVIKKAPGSFSVFRVANTESPQLVLLKAKKGSYGIIEVGNNTEYFNPYLFKVKKGAVNYAGDIKLELVHGNVFIWEKAKDYYDLSVSDNFDEILNLKETSELLLNYSKYEFINQARNTKKMEPLFCNIRRDN